MAVFDGCKRTPYGVVRARTSGTSGTTYSGTPLQVYSTTPVFHKFLGDMYPLVKGYFMGGTATDIVQIVRLTIGYACFKLVL